MIVCYCSNDQKLNFLRLEYILKFLNNFIDKHLILYLYIQFNYYEHFILLCSYLMKLF